MLQTSLAYPAHCEVPKAYWAFLGCSWACSSTKGKPEINPLAEVTEMILF